MCVRSYVSCGRCSARADEHVRLRELRTEVVYYTVDEDGDIADHDAEDYGEQVSTEEDGYECSACEATFSELDKDCTDPDCDCEECVPAIDNYDDPESFIKLMRTSRSTGRPNGDSIPELKQLIENRWLTHMVVSRERAEEIGDLDWSEHFYWDFDRHTPSHMELHQMHIDPATIEPRQEEIAA